MNIKSLLFVLTGIIFFTSLQGQHFMPGFCGVHAEDMELMEKLYPNDNKELTTFDRSNLIHIPIQFHLVATNSGSGRIQPHIVLKQLCKLNSDFSNTNIRFHCNRNRLLSLRGRASFFESFSYDNPSKYCLFFAGIRGFYYDIRSNYCVPYSIPFC